MGLFEHVYLVEILCGVVKKIGPGNLDRIRHGHVVMEIMGGSC